MHIALPQIISVDSNGNFTQKRGNPVEKWGLLCVAAEKKSGSDILIVLFF
jgi:hypothetical protein